MNGLLVVVLSFGWYVAFVVAAWLVIVIKSHARERVLWEGMLARITNVQTFGTPVPPRIESSRQPDAEERVQRMISEATLDRGVVELRGIYVNAGLTVPDDEQLRGEAAMMLGGLEPPIEVAHLPRDRG